MRVRYALAACVLVLATGIPAAVPAAAGVPSTAASGAVVKGWPVLGGSDPVEHATLVVYDAATGAELRSVETDGDGFRIDGLPAVAVKIGASSYGWLSGYANAKGTWATAKVFTLHAGQTLTLPWYALNLVQEAIVEGTVAGVGEPDGRVVGAKVVVFDAATGKALKSATTGGAGTYRILGLSNLVDIKVRAAAAGFRPVFNGGATTLGGAPPIDLLGTPFGGSTTVDLSLTRRTHEAVVTGEVLRWMDPYGDEKVVVYDAATGKALKSTTTNQWDGTFRIALPAIPVKIRASAPGWLPSYAINKTTLATADVFTPRAGQTLALPFDSLDLSPEAVVAGTVTRAGSYGDPVSGATVAVLDAATGDVLRSTRTRADGTYRIGGLSTQWDVKVRVTARGFLPAFNGGATTVADAPSISLVVNLLGITTVDLSMSRRQLGAAVEGQVLRWMDPYGDEKVVVYDAATGKALKSTMTDIEGNFRIGGLPAVPVKIRASAPGWLSSYANNKTSLATADVFTLQAGQTLTLPFDSLDLTPEAVVTGQVLRWSDPYGNEKVVVYDAATGKALKSTMTDIEGNFRIGGLPAVPVKVGASAAGLWLPSYADHRTTLATADVFTLQAGQTLTLPFDSLDLEPEAVVTGTVTEAGSYGSPVSGATVAVLDAATGDPLKSVKTAADGTYRIGGLSVLLDVKVRVTATGFLPALNGGATTVADAEPIILLFNMLHTTTVDLSLSRKQQPSVVSSGLDGYLADAAR